MKKLSFLALFSVLMSACSTFNIEHGSGKVTREMRNVTAFNSVELSSVFDVLLIPSDTTKVIVETDDNLQELVQVENNANTLIVKMKAGSKISYKTIGKIYIYQKELTYIKNASVGSLVSEGVLKSAQLTVKNSAVGKTALSIETDTLSVDNSAVGLTQLSGTSNTFKFVNKAVGNSNAKDLCCNYLVLENKAVGNTSVCVNIEAKISNSAVGALDVYGKGVIKEISNSSVGQFRKH